MKTNYEALFTACIKISGKWISLSNAIVAVATINTLWNTAFLLLGYPENVAFQSLSNRLFLVSFGCIGIAIVLGLIAIFAMRKVESK